MKDSALKFAGTLAVACQRLLACKPIDLSCRVIDINKALENYNDAIFKKTHPIVVMDKCPRCSNHLMPHHVDDDFDLICSNPSCEYELSVWRKE